MPAMVRRILGLAPLTFQPAASAVPTAAPAVDSADLPSPDQLFPAMLRS